MQTLYSKQAKRQELERMMKEKKNATGGYSRLPSYDEVHDEGQEDEQEDEGEGTKPDQGAELREVKKDSILKSCLPSKETRTNILQWIIIIIIGLAMWMQDHVVLKVLAFVYSWIFVCCHILSKPPKIVLLVLM